MGVRNPHSDSKQNRRSPKVERSLQQGKLAWHQCLGIIRCIHRALQAMPSLLTYSARPPLGSILGCSYQQPDEPVNCTLKLTDSYFISKE